MSPKGLILTSAAALVALGAGTMLWASSTCACVSERETVSSHLRALQGSIDLYRLKHHRYPRSLQSLKPGLLRRIPRDPWQRDYVYLPPGSASGGTSRRYCVFSLGPDQDEGTMDDILGNCDLEQLNKRRVMLAARHRREGRADVYGRPIKLIRTKSSLIAWSFGPDGQPDTPDDHTAVLTERGAR